MILFVFIIMGNCTSKKSKLTLEKLETDILMISSDQRRQMDQLVREIIILKQVIRKQNLDHSRRFTLCCASSDTPNDNMNKMKYI